MFPNPLESIHPHPHLGHAQIQHPDNPTIPNFLTACASNDTTTALQLAPSYSHDAGVLTFGLTRTVREGHLSLATQLLAQGAVWDTFTVDSASASLAGVTWLVEKGYDVNTSLMGGGTLLPVVCRNDEASIRYLLAHGANPSLGPKFGTQTPPLLRRPISTSAWILNDAAEHCSPAIFALLLSHGASLTGANAMPLHYAASQMSCARSGTYTDRMPMMRYLVEDLELDINAVDDAIKIADDGRGQVGTPLQYAIRFGRVEEAKWLLAKGADPDKRNQSGRSAREDAERLPEGYVLKDLLRDAGRQRGHRDSEVTYYAVFGRDVA